ncbi:MAG TPA: cell division protein FtsA [Candidatus Acidoferrales bacterium]|nr:cell division protein FtsA [Candidatus Acidoferrales bacterium]
MFDDPNIIAGLEIGTSKICVVVGEQGADGAVNIIGLGQARSRGVRKSEIIDPAQVEEDLRSAMFEAEQMADVEIRSVYLGVSGGHIRGFNNRGVHPVVSADREISPEDVEDVVKNAKAINLPAEDTVIHAVRQHFSVDGQDGVTNPVGMLGARLGVDMHVIHGNANRLQNAIRLVRATSLEVDDVVFNGIASSLALLNNEQKELGALVIDMGGGTTEFVVYSNGVMRHSGVLAVGGDHVSNDLAYGLKVPLSRAEKLKIEYGSAIVSESARGQTISLTNEMGLELRRINHEHLQRIMSLRLEEIFELVAQDLERVGLVDYLRAGVLLCGGGSRVPGMVKLAENVFQMNVSAGHACSVSGLTAALDQPEFAAAIGLVKFGSLKARRREGRSFLPRGLKDMFGKLLQRS